MIVNERGECTDCFAHLTGKFEVNSCEVNSCDALTDWYNRNDINNRCKGCPFFKTHEQICEEKERLTTRLRTLKKNRE